MIHLLGSNLFEYRLFVSRQESDCFILQSPGYVLKYWKSKKV